jgi:Sec-independent protein translocase protein TatA
VGRSLGSGIREFKEGISGAGAERRSAEAPAAPDDAERAGLPPRQPPSDTKATHSEVAADVAPAAWAGERVERQ